ncbi:hypothetical protein H4R18_004958 [Coemansia javaensis]|uniref:Translational machinery component n=1 Tax=Coemansia javaensis TaxID=2761396 RepID=A0A9W8LF19_9FUNG|nr:hypothetical protein H4R18_004958 [Coemansia javaensis]
MLRRVAVGAVRGRRLCRAFSAEKGPGGDKPAAGAGSTRGSGGDKASGGRAGQTPLLSLLDTLAAKSGAPMEGRQAWSPRFRSLLDREQPMQSDYGGLSGTGRFGGYTDLGESPEEADPMHKLVLHVHASSNNTILSLTDARGRVLVNASGGSVGFKKAQRAGFEAAYQATASIASAVKERGIEVRKIEVRLKGFGAGRDAAFKAVNSLTNWPVCAVTDATPIPFNGCRPRKARRL